jgi:ATP-dependent RNA helicase DeaD
VTSLIQSSPLARALAERNYTTLTPVQQAVLEPETEGRDLLVSAQTGSGKTVAFGLSMAPTLLEGAETLPPPAEPMALIVAPTRELALQVQRELEWLYAYTNAKTTCCVGGMDPRRERRALDMGAHIVVGTPGRLRDHIERGGLDISALKVVVLDEADEMLDMGFREDLEFILEATPAGRRTLLFSATMPKDIAALAKSYQKDALRIETASGQRGHADIEYRAIRILPREAHNAVVNILRASDSPTSIVFCATRESVRHMQALLFERGFSVVALSGELSQNERNNALQALRDGRAQICVATDVAARGIDLPRLDLVIHADLPQNAEVMQHRSGRTGRAGRKGISVLLVPPSRRRRAEQLFHIAKLNAQWSGAPSVDEIRKLDQERLLRDPVLTQEGTEDEAAMAALLLAERSPQDIAAALVRLYRSRLPAAEEVTDPGDGPAKTKGAKKDKSDRPTRDRDSHSPSRDRDSRSSSRDRDMGGVWFHLNIGRKANAEPRWLLPMLCRRGNITRQDIGAIRIFDRETKFEVAGHAAETFMHNVSRSKGDEGIIQPLKEGGQAPRHERDDSREPRRDKPFKKDKRRDDAPPRSHRKGGDDKSALPPKKPKKKKGSE